MKKGILIVLLLGICHVALAEDRRTNTAELVIMTFNAEFLWDGLLPEEGRVSFPWKGSPDEAAEHMAAIANVIIHSDPDIVNLVEVEGLAALKKLNTDFLQGRGYKVYLVKGKDSFTGQDVGLLTRVDPENDQIARHDGTGTSGAISKGVSKNYYARFQIGTQKIGLIGIHFLSRPTDEGRRHPRQAQSKAISNLAFSLNQNGYLPIILGDMNDYDDNPLDHLSHAPITDVLHTLKAMGTPDITDDLINVASLLPQPMRYTAHWDRNRNSQVDAPEEFSAIDHILVSPALSPLITSVDIPRGHNPLVVSDHFPVVAHLRIDGSGPTPTLEALRIISVLPNPPGDERQNEAVTVKNVGSSSISMQGWILRDRAGKTWVLDALASVTPGASRNILRNGQAMALNNSGDTVDLVRPDGTVVDSVTYSNASEGEVIDFAH